MERRIAMLTRHSFVVLLAFAWLLADVAHAQDDGQVQQYVQLLQPVMWHELNFIRQVCDLTAEQRPKIRSAADVAVKDGVKAVMQPQQARVNGAMIIRSQPALGAQAIRKSLHEMLKNTLTSEQLERYEAEDAKRSEASKQAAIMTAVARLDDALFLSKAQREQIREGLDKNWQSEWEQWLSLYRYGGQYAPQVPDQYVVPILNDEQKQIWGSLQKISANAWFNDGQEKKEDDWWNPRKVKTATAKTKIQPPGKAALLKASKKE